MPVTGLMSAAHAIPANVIVPPIVTTFGFLWLVVLPVIALVEGALIARFYSWRFGRAFWTALWINVLTALLGVFPALYGEFIANAAIGSFSIWAAFHVWPFVALGLLLAYYLATFIAEGILLYGRSPHISPSSRFGKALKISALFNAVTYLMIAPVWFIGMAPSTRGATLVHKSRWLPDIDETFLYQHPDGTLQLGTTQGEQLGEVCDELPPRASVLAKIEADGKALVLLQVPDDYWKQDLPLTPASPKELARYDLTRLRPELLRGLQPRDSSARLKPLPERAPGKSFDYRDGTLAWYRPFDFASPSLGIATDVQPRALFEGKRQLRPDDYDAAATWHVSGSPGMMSRLRFGSANVLPGGRYVLFECSGEIMVLDVEERKVVSLFPGTNPVALSSFEPEEEGDQPPISTEDAN